MIMMYSYSVSGHYSRCNGVRAEVLDRGESTSYQRTNCYEHDWNDDDDDGEEGKEGRSVRGDGVMEPVGGGSEITESKKRHHGYDNKISHDKKPLE